MSVTTEIKGSQPYVVLNHGGKALEVPCKDTNEAQKTAAELQILEAQMVKQEQNLGKTPEQYMDYLAQQASKPAGVGEKLDITSKA